MFQTIGRWRKKPLGLGGVSIAAGLCLMAQPLQAAPFFQGVGDPPLGRLGTFATGISDDGSVVVGTRNTGLGNKAFRWTRDGGEMPLTDLPSERTEESVGGVSGNGAVVVGQSLSQAYRWTEGGGIQRIGDLPGGGVSSLALGASTDGSVIVGGGSSAAGSEAFRWTEAGGMQGLGDLPGGEFSSQANSVSADGGVIVGGSISALGLEAFRWTEASGMQGLGSLPGGSSSSTALKVSADGAVVVGQSGSDSGFEAFRWTEAGGIQGLGDLPGGQFFSEANDVSADGSVVVGLGSGASGTTGFVWDALGGMRAIQDFLTTDFGLDLTGWQLQSVTGVSADGQVFTGWGTNPTGNTQAWIASIRPTGVLPEPATLALFGLGLAVLGWATRHRRAPGVSRRGDAA